MKKIYTFLLVCMVTINAAFAGTSCLIDSTNTQFFSPAPDSIPCVERGVSYTQIVQIHVPQDFDASSMAGLPAGFLVLNVDSLQIDSITGFPVGLGYAMNPFDGFYLGGDNGCTYLYGITNSPAGNYPLTVHGTISVSGIPPGAGFPPDTTFQLQQLQSLTDMFTLAVDVIEEGDPCRATTNIKNFSADLNAALSVYPNPSNGNFELKLNAGGRVNGEIVVTNVTGARVFTQTLDVTGMYNTSINLSSFAKGLYTVQIRTAEGFASKSISIQ